MQPSELTILYSDNHLLVVVKPGGVPIQADASGDTDLLSLAKAWVKQEFAKPGAVFLGLVHRLDRPARGVVVFARTSKAAARMSEQFRMRSCHKVYEAVVCGQPPESETELCDWLKPGEGTTRLAVVGQGQEARLRMRRLASQGNQSVVEIVLLTGRKHQIRAQLAVRGWPILGDLRYGATAALPDRCIALWAKSLAIDHPISRERLTFVAPPPPGWPWAPCEPR